MRLRNLAASAAWMVGATITITAASADLAQAQSYPTRPIRLIVGYTPAGAADFIARIVGDAVGKRLGQPMLVDNKPGAGSTLASTLLAHAPADGYTLGLATASMFGIDQYLYKSKYTNADFTPISLLTISPLVLAVNKKLPINNVSELAAYAKANPGKLNYSSSGIGGSPHMAGLLFEKAIGAKMTHVPYKGGAPALQGVAAGEIDLSFGTAPSVLPLGREGIVRMLAVSTAQRSPVAPELPTVAESGLPDFDFTFWFGMFGPANLPKDIQKKLFDAVVDALNDPEVKAKLLASGNETSPSKSPAEFAAWAQKDGKTIAERAMAAGVRVE